MDNSEELEEHLGSKRIGEVLSVKMRKEIIPPTETKYQDPTSRWRDK
jgi:hypothetical protein